MPTSVSDHYTHGDLVAAIRAGIASLGKTPGSITSDDLAPIDEFHIGGREATAELIGQLALSATDHVLDIGCGLGGAARFVADRHGCRVTGIDVTREYVDVGNMLCEWVGLADRISLQHGDALSIPFPDRTFDGAWMLHVGMNIADKARLCSEVGRVLKPGARFAIYDVMRTAKGEITYPLPWATTAALSAVTEPEEYRKALQSAGFTIVSERNRRDFALAYFDEQRAKVSAAGALPPLGLHILMGEKTRQQARNMHDNIAAGRLAPVELISEKR
jgi:ubiquinone/menaquinone biosynthesis C-methylase UbiE